MQQEEARLEGLTNGRNGSKNTNKEKNLKRKKRGLGYLQHLTLHLQHTNTVPLHKGQGVSVSIGTAVRSMTLNIS